MFRVVVATVQSRGDSCPTPQDTVGTAIVNYGKPPHHLNLTIATILNNTANEPTHLSYIHLLIHPTTTINHNTNPQSINQSNQSSKMAPNLSLFSVTSPLLHLHPISIPISTSTTLTNLSIYHPGKRNPNPLTRHHESPSKILPPPPLHLNLHHLHPLLNHFTTKQPLPNPKRAKTLRKRPRRENLQIKLRHNPLRQPRRSLQSRIRRNALRSRRSRRERNAPLAHPTSTEG